VNVLKDGKESGVAVSNMSSGLPISDLLCFVEQIIFS
jgi:hypothetical protein